MDQSRPGDLSKHSKFSNKEMNIKILFDHLEKFLKNFLCQSVLLQY